MATEMRLAFVARLGLKELQTIRFINQLSEYYDLIILGGDGTPDPEYLVRNKVLIVSGDEDDILITKKAREYNMLIDGRICEFKGLKIAGVGGLQPHQDIRRIIREGSNINILISHYPPHGCLDKVLIGRKEAHMGIIDLNKLLADNVRLLMLFTHTNVLGGLCLRNNVVMIGFEGGIGRYAEVFINGILSIGFKYSDLPSH